MLGDIFTDYTNNKERPITMNNRLSSISVSTSGRVPSVPEDGIFMRNTQSH